MLLILGVAGLVIGAVAAVAAKFLPAKESLSEGQRRLFRSAAFSNAAVLLMCLGGLAALVFLADYTKEGDVPLQLGIAAVLIVAGYGAIHAIKRWAGPADGHGKPAA